MYDHICSKIPNHKSDIRPHINWAVSLVIAYGHFNLPLGFVWVFIRVVKLLLIVMVIVMKHLWSNSNSNRLLKIPE